MTKSTKSTVTKDEIRFSEVEIQRINDLRIAVSGVFTQLGQISIEKLRLETEYGKATDDLGTNKDALLEKHAELVETEKTLYKELNEKYGNGNFDPETGIFTPTEES